MDGLIGGDTEAMRGSNLGSHDVGFVAGMQRAVDALRVSLRRASPGPLRPNPHLLSAEGARAAARVTGGCGTAATPASRLRARQNSGRVYMMAPARWKSDALSAHRLVDWAALAPTPAQWRVSRELAAPLPVAMLSWSEVFAALLGSVPRGRWSAGNVSARSLIEAQIRSRGPWFTRTQVVLGWQGRCVTSRHVVAGFVSLVAVAVLMGSGRMHSSAMPISNAMLAAPASAAPVVAPPTVAAAKIPPPPVAIAPVAAPLPTKASAESSATAETGDVLLADVSAMDLMMPVAEPDLDITSRHSLWAQVGKASGIDPLLLYSVALVESKALYPDGKVAPTPWLFRVNDHLVSGDRHHVQLEMAAASQFGSAVQDVGIMQVYYPMHRDAVHDPLTLLNPRTNITVAAKILRQGMRQTSDRVLGVGYYHSHTPSLARNYGTAVLTVYQRLKGVYRPRGGRQLVAR